MGRIDLGVRRSHAMESDGIRFATFTEGNGGNHDDNVPTLRPTLFEQVAIREAKLRLDIGVFRHQDRPGAP